MYKPIFILVKSCLRFKQPPERAEMKQIQVSHPMDLIHFDFLTLGGKTGDIRGSNIMVITDHFMRYAQAYVTPKQTAAVAARALWENFLVHYRWPEKILTNQGRSFESNLFRELCSLAKIKSNILVLTILRPMVNVNILMPL